MVGFPESYKEVNMESARRAALLVSNFKSEENADELVRVSFFPSQQRLHSYLQHLVSADLFSHTWSICVELQTYALIPVIYFVQSKVVNNEILVFTGKSSMATIIFFLKKEEGERRKLLQKELLFLLPRWVLLPSKSQLTKTTKKNSRREGNCLFLVSLC